MVKAQLTLKDTDLHAEFVNYATSKKNLRSTLPRSVEQVTERERAVGAREKAVTERERVVSVREETVAMREEIVTRRELAVARTDKESGNEKANEMKKASKRESAGQSTSISSGLSGYAVETESKANSIERKQEQKRLTRANGKQRASTSDIDQTTKLTACAVNKRQATRSVGRGAPGVQRAPNAFNKFVQDNKERFREEACRKSTTVLQLACEEWRRRKEEASKHPESAVISIDN